MWNVYEVDVAHRLEAETLACTQHVRARTPDEAVKRVLAAQGPDAVHLPKHTREGRQRNAKGQVVPVTQSIKSPRIRRACDAIESAQEQARVAAPAKETP